MRTSKDFHVLPLFRVFSLFLSLLFFLAFARVRAFALLLFAAFPQVGDIGDILKSSRIVSNIHQPEVERSIEPGQTQRAFGTDIPVSNAAGNGRSFRVMMRPDTHILVNIFNRVSDRRDVREIRSQSAPNEPLSALYSTITRWCNIAGQICILLHISQTWYVITVRYQIVSL